MPITHPKHENDFKLIFNNKVYEISKCLFGLYSKAFRHHPSFIFKQSLDMSEKKISNDTFEQFVNACQAHFFNINETNCYDFLQLCEKWEVDVIKEEVTNFIANINDTSSKILKLKFYLSQNDSSYKNDLMNQKADEKYKEKEKENKVQIINDIEEFISQHINSYLDDPLLASLPISSLFRIISKSFSSHKSDLQNEDNNNDYDIIDKHLFLKFLESVSNHHKEASRVLIKLIDDYGEFTPSEHKKLKEVSNPFTNCNFSSDATTFFNNLSDQNDEIESFEKEISAIKKEGERNIKKIEGEVKTLRHSIKKSAKNSPTQSKSFSNLSSIADSTKYSLATTPKSPVLSNSVSNLEYASKNSGIQSDSEIDQNSDFQSPNKNQHHNQHPNVPLPPNSHLSPIHEHRKSNSEILELLNQLLNQYNQIKNLNINVSKSVQNYTEKLTEFSKSCDQITVKITDEKAKAIERAREMEKSSEEQKSQKQQKPKSFSTSTKSSEKGSSKSQKHSLSTKIKNKEKTSDKAKSNDNDNQSETSKISVPKTNFQVIKQNNKRQSHSVKEPEHQTRVSFSEKSSSKHSKGQKTTPSSPQSAATPQSASHNGQGMITVLSSSDLNNFNGLIYQLRCLNTSRDLNGNLAISASSIKMAMAQPENVLKSDSVFCTENRENQWILFDFISRKINVVNYKIRSIPYQTNSFHMKSWVVEGSDENNIENDESWTLIDKRENNSLLNKSGAIAVFDVSNSNKAFFRFVRIRMIGPNHTNTYVFGFAQIEFFGSLKFDGDL